MKIREPFNQSLKKSDEHEFLPAALEVLDTPPSRSGRYMAFLLAGFFVFAVVWAILGTLDIVVIAQGQTVPTGKVKTLQTFETGVVRAVHVKDGQYVEKGDLLIEMDPTETVANVDTLQAQWIQASVEAELGDALLQDSGTGLNLPTDTPELIKTNTQILLVGMRNQHIAGLNSIDADIGRQESTIASAHIQQSMLDQKLPLLQERLAAQENLLEKGITQKPLVLELRESLIVLLHQQQSVEESIHESEAAIASLAARRAETVSKYRTTAAQNRHAALNKLSSIEQDLKKANQRQKYRELRAPVTGFVDKLAIYTIGAVLDAGTQVLTVVPADTPLEIDAVVLNKDIGFIEVGQMAEIKLEAFPFTRYGVLDGKIISISNDVAVDEQLGPIYRAKVQLESQTIRINGKELALSPGMNASTEVKTGKRRIIEYFLSPLLRYRDEAIRER